MLRKHNTLRGPSATPSVGRLHIIQASRGTLRRTLTLLSKYSSSTNNLSISTSQVSWVELQWHPPAWPVKSVDFLHHLSHGVFIAFSPFWTRSRLLSGWWQMMHPWPCLCRAQHLMRNSAINKIIWIANVGLSQRFLGLYYILFQNGFIIKPDPRPC